MALKRILGTAVRHPLAATALVAGVAKGTLTVVQRLFKSDDPWSSTDEVTSVPTATEREPEVVVPRPEPRDLPEPVVIYADDDEPETVVDPDGHVDLDEELVWTSESPRSPE